MSAPSALTIDEFLDNSFPHPIPLSKSQIELLLQAVRVYADKLDPDLPIGRDKISSCKLLEAVLQYSIKKSGQVHESLIANLQAHNINVIDITQG